MMWATTHRLQVYLQKRPQLNFSYATVHTNLVPCGLNLGIRIEPSPLVSIAKMNVILNINYMLILHTAFSILQTGVIQS